MDRYRSTNRGLETIGLKWLGCRVVIFATSRPVLSNHEFEFFLSLKPQHVEWLIHVKSVEAQSPPVGELLKLGEKDTGSSVILVASSGFVANSPHIALECDAYKKNQIICFLTKQHKTGSVFKPALSPLNPAPLGCRDSGGVRYATASRYKVNEDVDDILRYSPPHSLSAICHK
ncbi:hypothetical protein TNCV_3961011 [Trichonephila clavipes]|nr:hypothetical protein TNCV_3961011 [Trichonephila clavipes]